MIGFLLPLFARWGLSQRVSKALAIGVLILGLALLAGALWLWLDARERADDRANQEIGATKAIVAGQQTTLETIGKANEAAEAVRRDSAAARDECLRNARNPGDC